MRIPEISIISADIRRFEIDLLILKYARGFNGVDKTILSYFGLGDETVSLEENEVRLLGASVGVEAKCVCLIGTKSLPHFGFGEVRQFGRRMTEYCHKNLADPTKVVGTTMHGAGCGLSEKLAFSAQVSGMLEYSAEFDSQGMLPKFRIFEKDAARAERLKGYLFNILSEI